jgi:hypothetical protein
MKNTFKMMIGGLIMATSIGFSSIHAQASEPEKVNYSKATYDAGELKRNLGTVKLAVKSDPTEKVSFKVELDKTGEIKELTYTQNITSEKPEKVESYIQKAYMAIMSTTFYPAKKDGQAISDTVTIDFELVN